MDYDRESPLIQPYYVIEEINKLTRGETIITTGVGQTNVGRAVLRFPSRVCGSPRAAWERWDSGYQPRSARSSRSARDS